MKMKTERERRGEVTDDGVSPRVAPAAAGFTLAELLIVISVALVVMVLVVPWLQHNPQRVDEVTAINSLRTIHEMEGQYIASYPSHGYACSLSTLGGSDKSGPISAESAHLIHDDLANGTAAGYKFSFTGCGEMSSKDVTQHTSYRVTAVPVSVGRSGYRGFCLDDSGEISFDPKGGTACTEPLRQ